MKAKETMVLEFLQNSPQFVIPIYQRTYSWDLEQCEQLWDDVLRAGKSKSSAVHFVGSIVYVADGLSTVANQAPLLVIDGQQRLTTISLLLEALRRALKDDEEPINGFTSEKIRTRYLTRHLEKDERFFKLLLSQTDNETLKALIQNRELPPNKSVRLSENFDYFVNQIEGLKGQLETLCHGIAKLAVVEIALNRGEDNPQAIFESMNSTGKVLSQADLIRNFVLMGLQPETQAELYESYWRPMELDFGQHAYSEEFDSFMRHFLTIKFSEIPRIDQIYRYFKEYATKPEVIELGEKALVQELRLFARYYCAISLGKEDDAEIKLALGDLKEFRVEVAYPFILEVYHDWKLQLLTKEEFLKIVRLVESYAFRRAVVQLPANSMNKTFARLSLSIDKKNYLQSFMVGLQLMKTYRRFPSDEEFARELKIRDLYNFRRASYWLKKLEFFGRKEFPVLEEYSIEHILPQNPELNSWWQIALGKNWKDVQAQWLHTIGNLTLTKYNPEFSDKSFIEKRDLPSGGFKTSPLILNQGLGLLETWDSSQIQKRADVLIHNALLIWESPNVDPRIIASLESQVVERRQSTYTYEEHQYLSRPAVKSLFDDLKNRVLAIDPSVYEEILKLYIAFKAETNFVDVITKASGLRLTINIPFSELKDPRGLALNVKNLGRWGNGESSIQINTHEDIDYAIFLIRQAFDRQNESVG